MNRLKSFSDFSIKNKLIILILFVTFVILFLVFFIISLREVNNLKTTTKSQLLLNARLIGDYCVVPLAFENKAQAEDAISRLGLIESVEEGCLFDSNGNIFATFPDTLTKNQIASAIINQPTADFIDGYFYITQPVTFREELIGLLYIKAGSGILKDEYIKLTFLFVIFFLVMLVFTYLLAVWVQRILAAPIVNLAKITEGITKDNDFSVRIKHEGNDEIGILYREFNNLIVQLQKKKNERDEAEKEISFLAQVIKNINEFVCITDLNDNIFFVNQSWLKTFGYSKSEVIGKNISLIVSKNNPPGFVEEILPRTLEGGWQGEVLNKRKDGTEFPVMLFTTIIYDDEGKPVSLVGISSDITERKHAETALKTSEEKLRSILDNSADALFLTDTDGNYTYVNKAAVSLLGYKRREILARNILDLAPPEKEIQYSNKYKELLKTGKMFTEIELVKKDGTIIPADLNAVLLPDGQVYGSCRDITERVKAQQELIKHKEHLEKLVDERTQRIRKYMDEIQDLYDNAPCGYHSVNEEGIIVRMNTTELKWLRYNKEEVIGRMSTVDFLSTESRKKYNALFSLLKKKGYVKNVEFEYVRKDGTTFFGSLNASVIYDSNGKFLMSRSTLFDVTGHREAKQALDKARKEADAANNAKSEFLANMSHEIRTPMNAVLGYTELLSKKVTDETEKEYLNSIKTSGSSLLKLINDILDLSKVEAGKLDLEYGYVDMNSFFSEFDNIFSLKIKEKGLKFTLNISSGTPLGIYIDESRVRQIVLNLIGNAVKYTVEGEIILRVYTDNPKHISEPEEEFKDRVDIIIEVEDTGVGIPVESQQLIFEPFTQEKNIKDAGGTGLGLPITRKLTMLMNGNISLKSEPGKGSIFTVRIPDIPYLRDFSGTDVSDNIDPELIRFNKSRILVVDDVEHNRTYLRDTLIDTNITVDMAENGVLALDKIKKDMPDLVICDIKMPVMNGFRLLEEIKSDNKIKHIPVVAYSASVIREQQQLIHESDFDDLLIKPVRVTELYNILIRFLSHEKIESQISEDGFDEDLNYSEIVNPDELIIFLENLVPVWERFSVKQPVGEVREFGNVLVQKGEEHNSNSVLLYGKQLINAAENFNIEMMMKLLANYKKIIEEIKKSRH